MSISSVNRSSFSVPSSRTSSFKPVSSPARDGASTPVSQSGNALRNRFMSDSFEQGPSKLGGASGSIKTAAPAELQKVMQQMSQMLSEIKKMLQSMQGGQSGQSGGAGAGASQGGGDSSVGQDPGGDAAPVDDGSGAASTGGPSAPQQASPVAAPSAPQQASPVAAPSASGGGEGDSKLGPGLPKQLEPYRGAIENASAKTGVPANMLAAQIWQESRGNLSATTTNGGNGLTDTGLMQVNPNTFGELQSKHPELQGMDLKTPEGNIMAGAAYMKDMKDQFGDWKTALRAYNSGPNGVDKNNLNALPAGTGDATYVDKVSQFWNTLQTGNGSLPA